jgi:hypothetical protein
MRAEIATKQALHTLIQLHAELGGRINQNKRDAVRLAETMKAVEAVIKLIKPDFNVNRIAVRRRNRRNKWFKRGTMFRAVLVAMREAGGPATVREIAVRMLKTKGVENPERQQIVELESGVRACLVAKRGKAVHKLSNEVPARWNLNP